MRAIAYLACFALVAIPSLYIAVATVLSLIGVPVPFPPWFTLFHTFGSLVPPMLAGVVPHLIKLALGIVLLALVLRRAWLFFAKRERTPAEFAGFRKVLGYVGFWSLVLGALALLASALLRLGSGVPGGMLLIPAVMCIPWAFFLTEVTSIMRGRAARAA